MRNHLVIKCGSLAACHSLTLFLHLSSLCLINSGVLIHFIIRSSCFSDVKNGYWVQVSITEHGLLPGAGDGCLPRGFPSDWLLDSDKVVWQAGQHANFTTRKEVLEIVATQKSHGRLHCFPLLG